MPCRGLLKTITNRRTGLSPALCLIVDRDKRFRPRNARSDLVSNLFQIMRHMA